MVPACRSLDCVSIFALTAEDARAVFAVARGFDERDPWSRPPAAAALPDAIAGCRIGVPRAGQLEFFGNRDAERLFAAALAALERSGARRVEIDFAPFDEAARLLYGGPWVAERYQAIREFFDRRPEAVFPVTREILAGAAKYSAADTFAAEYRLQEIRRTLAPVWQEIDLLVTPDRRDDLHDRRGERRPGRAEHQPRLLHELHEPARPRGDRGAGGVPGERAAVRRHARGAGVHRRGTVPAGRRAAPRSSSTGWARPGVRCPRRRSPRAPSRASSGSRCAARTCRGLPLNHQLTERGGRLVRTCRTAPRYRLYALSGFTPPRPGMVRSDAGGSAIEVEVWAVPSGAFGSFVDGIPPPLGIGTVELEDGERVRGFVCEGYAVAGANDISALGSWRKFAG